MAGRGSSTGTGLWLLLVSFPAFHCKMKAVLESGNETNYMLVKILSMYAVDNIKLCLAELLRSHFGNKHKHGYFTVPRLSWNVVFLDPIN